MSTFFRILKLSLISFWGVGLGVVIVLAFFNHPSLDDYSYAVIANDSGLLNSQFIWFNEWSGRYFSTFLLSINPLYFHSLVGYKVSIAFLILLFFITLYLIGSRYFMKEEVLLDKISGISAFCILYCIVLPTFSEGFYWFASAITYQFASVLLICFLFIAFLIQKGGLSRFRKVIAGIGGMVLLFFLAGSNEIMLIISIFLCLFLCVFFATKKRFFPWIQILWLIVVLVGGFIVYSSPGNAVRSGVMGHDLSYGSIAMNAGLSLISFLMRIILPFLSFSLIVFSFIWFSQEKKTSVEEKPVFYVNPFVSITLIILLTYILFIAGWYSTHDHLPARAENVLLFQFFIGWLWTLNNTLVFLKKKRIHIARKLLIFACISACIGIVWFSLRENNIRSAFGDLLLKRAIHYDEEMRNRDAMLLSSKEDTVLIPDIQNRPAMLFVGDIHNPAFPGQYQSYCKYYNKKCILIKPLIKQ